MTRNSFVCAVLLCLTWVVTATAQMVGAYSNIPVNAPPVVAAARFAVATQNTKLARKSMLLEITRAQRQLVGGVNYKLCLRLKSGDTQRQAEAVVFQNLQQQRKLNTWAWNKCSIK